MGWVGGVGREWGKSYGKGQEDEREMEVSTHTHTLSMHVHSPYYRYGSAHDPPAWLLQTTCVECILS